MSEATETYFEHVTDAASRHTFTARPQDQDPGTEEHLLSVEALPENAATVDFSTFAADYPEKLFPLLSQLRPEFQEMFIEYYVLHKSQEFIARCHGFVQTRTWQTLRIIEQAIGSLLVLGAVPSVLDMHETLVAAGLNQTEFGSLASLIAHYAATRDYATVAAAVRAPAPEIRKIFRPAIKTLLSSPKLKVAAIGAYLKSLTHQSARTNRKHIKTGPIARLARIGTFTFDAPSLGLNHVLEQGDLRTLRDRPWQMFEISSEHRMDQIRPTLPQQLKKLYGTKALQVFAPVNEHGELTYGYLFFRSTAPARKLLKVRGIAFMVARYIDATHSDAILVPDADVKTMMNAHPKTKLPRIRVRDFVQVLTGPAAGYCGVVTAVEKPSVRVEVNFPTGRRFLIRADISSVKPLDAEPERQTFWGVKPN